MEHKIKREWKSIVCPAWKEQTVLMCEWDLLSEKENILQRTLKQIDCHNPRLSELGRADCNWACQRTIAKTGAIRSGAEQLLVCIILTAGIVWISFYKLCLSKYLRPYGLFFFIGIPFLIGLMFYYGSKMLEYVRRAWQHGHLLEGVSGKTV